MTANWPHLPALAEWRKTLETVHLWTQIIGKIRLECGPPLNHSWGVALYVTPRGLTTSAIPYEDRTFDVEFDFVNHVLQVRDSDGGVQSFDLEPMSVAEFYRRVMDALGSLSVEVDIYLRPVEIPDPITRFDEDVEHASYDADAVHRFWRALVQADRVLASFRASYVGKASPSHFFWGAFDLATTRFSGRRAPRHPGGVPNCPDRVMVEAYSHEVASAGFWPGGEATHGEVAFYAYAYPEPEGFRDASIRPPAAYYTDDLREFLLPYSTVVTATDPDRVLLDFLQSTYEAAADLGHWDRASLERST